VLLVRLYPGILVHMKLEIAILAGHSAGS
jgi:hypothetical protein